MSDQKLSKEKDIKKHDARTKGLKSAERITKEILQSLVGKTNKEISEVTGKSIYMVKKSLIEHNLYTGKIYYQKCESCGETFGEISNGHKFCSNHCKHQTQLIWNKGLTKETSELLNNASVRMKGNQLHTLVNYHKNNLVKMLLPTLNVEIEYDGNSKLEKDWLLLVDTQPGIISIERPTFAIEYIDTMNKARSYYPDFIVQWETGVKWIVEIKGIATDDDYLKIEHATKWCIENGFNYRVITTGMVKTDTWATVHSNYKNIKIPSKEFVAMNYACTLAKCSISPRMSVGCVIYSMDFGEIYAFGYNGDEKGGSNVPTSISPGQDKFLHAEENALLKLKTKEPCKMFITDSPCEMCAKRIINSGNIQEVYYLRPYRDMTGVGLLMKAGIKVYHFKIINYKGDVYHVDDALKIVSSSDLEL